LEKSRKAWECGICLQMILPHRQPAFLGCSHLACKPCLESVLASVAPATSAPCPLCVKPFSKADIKLLKDENPLSYRNLLALYIGCPLECAWNGDTGNLEDHFQTCPKAKCPLTGCGAVVMLPETVSVGSQFDLFDAYVLTTASFQEHLEKCPKVILEYPHDRCNVRVTRDKLAEHDSECVWKEIECPEPGCTHQCMQKNMSRHTNNDDGIHLRVMKQFAMPFPPKEPCFFWHVLDIFDSDLCCRADPGRGSSSGLTLIL